MNPRPHIIIVAALLLEWFLESTFQQSLLSTGIIAATIATAVLSPNKQWIITLLTLGILIDTFHINNSVATSVSFFILVGIIVILRKMFETSESALFAGIATMIIALLYPAILWFVVIIEQKLTQDGGQHFSRFTDFYGLPQTIIEVLVAILLFTITYQLIKPKEIKRANV